jgi:hypothetical protein
MVEFRKDGYSIHVHVGYNPIEDWIGLHEELLNILAFMDEQSMIKHWRTLSFINEMLPELDVAKKMVEG